ncbi:MAG: helix-turn-helix domain-containing protein [Candidatus Bipolaricaulia bacterium]
MRSAAEFGRAIRILRKRLGLTLEEMKQRGFDQSYLCELEQGRHDPRLSYILRLARGLQVEVADLLGGLGMTPKALLARVGVSLDQLILKIVEMEGKEREALCQEALQLFHEREARIKELLVARHGERFSLQWRAYPAGRRSFGR